MAKKKPVRASADKTVSSTTAITSSADGKSAVTKSKPAKTKSRPFSDEQIGLVAGEIWHFLATAEGQTLASVKKSIEASPDLTTAAIGWLAREGKLDIAGSGRSVKLSLR
jgi:predicted double-glycine peptidase